ncbi:MAG TPA: hypothetical protein VFK54_02455 [Candidatus Limnocylindrales bacterium]|nr:hypothetical protein [Candidatus Limnocylindrales bacterium]
MPPEAFALVGLFAVVSIVLGVGAWWIARAVGGPRRMRWAVLPAAAAFGVLYVVGHRVGLVLGPEVELFGFQVALFGDIAIGGFAAVVTGLVVAAVRRSSRAP